MVYGNSVGHEYVVRLHPRKTVLGLPPVEWFPPLSQDVAPLFSSRNVGAQFAAEISSFIDSRKSLDVLGRSQLKSVIKSPNLPRGLRIHWWRRDESYSPWYNISGNTPGWYTLLETLLMCHPRGLAAMEIVLHFSEPTRCTRLLRRIAPAVFQFKDMGVGISVVRSCVSKKNNFPGLPAAYPRTEYDLTWLFDGTLKDFKEKIFICGRTRNLVSTFVPTMTGPVLTRSNIARAGKAIQEGRSPRWLRPTSHCRSGGS